MRRVVITGMGIVSSIGNNTTEVLQSLKDATPGIVFAEDYAKYNFRCQVHGAPKLDPFEVLDRRTTRFMGKGAAWNYIAMQQAIEQSGLEEKDIKNPMTGIVMGSGGPSTRAVPTACTVEGGAPSGVGSKFELNSVFGVVRKTIFPRSVTL